jgi:DNA excision repair protein ERCC-2
MGDNDLFPFKTMRRGQEEIIQDVSESLAKGKSVINYFPQGVGKTSAVLTSTLEYSKKSRKRIFFLTNRRMQHNVTVDILKKIGLRMQGLKVVDLPTGSFKCPKAEEEGVSSGFSDTCVCSMLGRCRTNNFELNVYRSIKNNILNFQETVEMCMGKDICPVEMALNAAQEADVIICDYRYIFTEEGEWLIEYSKLNYRDSILIVDESHRLPDHIKSSLTISLTRDIINGAIQEADERRQKNIVFYLNGLNAILEALSEKLSEEGEAQIEREVLVNSIRDLLRKRNYGRLSLDEFLESLQILDATLRHKKGYTDTYRVLRFLKQWIFPTSPMVAVMRVGEEPKLMLNCLDPSVISKDIFSQIHSAVLMSSTPIPPEMYIDILGIPSRKLVNRSYESFSAQRPLTFLSDKNITTSNAKRSPDMYSAIAEEVLAISTKVPGNLAVFFPSKLVLQNTLEFLEKQVPNKVVFVEGLGRKDRIVEGLEGASRSNGGILLGIQGGYFSDSPEFKRNLFSGIVVVGIPFLKPDVEQRASMEYLKSRFGGMKGYYYSQIYPAMSKVVQTISGREGDEKGHGVCILMDYRFKDPKFLKALPPEYHIDVEPNVPLRLEEIFNGGGDDIWGNQDKP